MTRAMEECDVACLLYDGSDPQSFSIAASMLVSMVTYLVGLSEGVTIIFQCRKL